MIEDIKPMTEEVVSYKCNWCSELYNSEYFAAECAFKHAKENLANALLEDGYTLESINYRCGFNWTLSDVQKSINKDNCFIMSYWQCCDKPAYRIVSINSYGKLKLWGKGGWSGYYGDYVDISRLSSPYPKEKLFIDSRYA